MINLHERLSEFTFGYGITHEICSLLRDCGYNPTPFLPSLYHEGELGFDVAFSDNGLAILLQFKLGQELRRYRNSSSASVTPILKRPFWRFQIDAWGEEHARLDNYHANFLNS